MSLGGLELKLLYGQHILMLTAGHSHISTPLEGLVIGLCRPCLPGKKLLDAPVFLYVRVSKECLSVCGKKHL